jgi:hypothetical protein
MHLSLPEVVAVVVVGVVTAAAAALVDIEQLCQRIELELPTQ